MIAGLLGYLGEGVSFTMGAMPTVGPGGGGVWSAVNQNVFNFAGQHFVQNARTGPMPNPFLPVGGAELWTSPNTRSSGRAPIGGRGRAGTPGQIITKGTQGFPVVGTKGRLGGANQGWSRYLGPTIGMGSTAYFAYQGYQENGMSGLYDAVMLDVAAGAAATKHGYLRTYFDTSGKEVSKKWAMKNPAMAIKNTRVRTFLGVGLSPITSGLGAYVLGGVGQDIGEATGLPGGATAGVVAGAYMGARIARSPLALLGYGALIAGGRGLVKGAYNLLKTGYRRKQFMRQAHTAGDTAAFMTGSAVTMRQRAAMAMQKSHMNARSALGMEAGYMHMPRNYFSTYARQGNMM